MDRLSDKVRITQHSNGAAVLHISRGRLFSLNPVGLRIVELLKSGLSKQQIAESVATEFNVGALVAVADTEKFLAALKEHGVLEA